MKINGQDIPDPLGEVQSDIKNLLLGDPALGLTPIYRFKEFLAQAVQDQNISIWQPRGGKVGTAIEVRMPAVRAVTPNVPGPQQFLEITIRVMEDAAQNTTGTTCEALAWEVQAWLDGQGIAGISTGMVTLYPDPRNPALKPVYGEYHDRFAYDVIMVAEWPQDARARVATPTYAQDGQNLITITQPDGISPVYYTLDGSMPIIPTPGAQNQPGPAIAPTMLYAAPFGVPAGTITTIISWRPGTLPSFPLRLVN